MAGGALCLYFFYLGQTLPGEVERLDDEMRIFYHLCPLLGAGATLIGLFLAYRSLRDALRPERSALAQSIRNQLPHPDEAPPVKELFAMVDQDLKQNGLWCGKLGIGKEWVLGDQVSRIPRIRGVFSRSERHTRRAGKRTIVTYLYEVWIRGVFSRSERHTRRAGKRTIVTYLYEVWIVDDRRERQVTSLRSQRELDDAMDCLRRRVPAAVFGTYNSREYNDLIYTKEEEQQYAQERAYHQRAAQFEEQNRRERESQAQNQVLTLADGSVTSRITGETLRELLLRPGKTGEESPFQLVPGVPIQGEQGAFSRLACLPGGFQEPVRILLEEYSGTPGVPGQYAWAQDLSAGEAETVLWNWLRGELPALEGWTQLVRAGRSWRPLDGRSGGAAPTPPQPNPDWPWALNVGGIPHSDPSWQEVESGLRELVPDPDSFLILEQREPGNPEHCWFLQCAVASRGPDAGKYAVEIGCPSPDGPRLWERMVPDVQGAIQAFSDAYHHRGLDVSGFRETEV